MSIWTRFYLIYILVSGVTVVEIFLAFNEDFLISRNIVWVYEKPRTIG